MGEYTGEEGVGLLSASWLYLLLVADLSAVVFVAVVFLNLLLLFLMCY